MLWGPQIQQLYEFEETQEMRVSYEQAFSNQVLNDYIAFVLLV